MDKKHLEDLYDSALRELEETREENERLKALCEKYGKINEQETKDYAELKQENERYKSALEEITSKILNQIAWEGGLSYLDQEIINIINEVEE